MKRQVTYSNWRDDLREVVDVPSSQPKTQEKSERKIEEKDVNNKVVINPTTSEANEVFKEIGGTVLELFEQDIATLERTKANQLIAIAKTNQNIANKKMKKTNQPQDDTQLEVQERTLTPEEEKEKEYIVKGMKKKEGDFEKRYGDDAKSVMYATATKMAKEETGDAVSSGAFDAVTKGLPPGALINTKKRRTEKKETPWHQNHLRTDPKPNRYDKKND